MPVIFRLLVFVGAVLQYINNYNLSDVIENVLGRQERSLSLLTAIQNARPGGAAALPPGQVSYHLLS
jgi:hypothetical protein